jgi:hypothetical protein
MGNMALPVLMFVGCWGLWEIWEVVVMNYKGDTRYISKSNKVGKDLSIAVFQVR